MTAALPRQRDPEALGRAACGHSRDGTSPGAYGVGAHDVPAQGTRCGRAGTEELPEEFGEAARSSPAAFHTAGAAFCKGLPLTPPEPGGGLGSRAPNCSPQPCPSPQKGAPGFGRPLGLPGEAKPSPPPQTSSSPPPSASPEPRPEPRGGVGATPGGPAGTHRGRGAAAAAGPGAAAGSAWLRGSGSL